MNTRRFALITLFTLTAIGTASCDITPVTPEIPENTAIPVTTSQDTSEPAVVLRAGSPDRFQFEIVLVDEGAHAIRSRILAQADRWARIVQATDLEDVEWEPGTVSCRGLEYDFQKDLLDDVLVMVSVQDLDGGSGAGVRSSICGYRSSSLLPIIGAIILDLDGQPQGEGDDLILHAFGHMLGFANSWPRLELLRDPSRENEGADTHFVGAGAVGAFVAAGGANYQGAKVPVENVSTYGPPDGHWRESVFDTELMTSFLQYGVADQLSAITIQSLADIGYTVDVELADVYTLPGRSVAVREGGGGRSIDLSGDVLTGPVVLYDRKGRVVQVLPN